ncbi:MAG: hypothetical protein ABH840_01700 [Nanoarchaeota archaeon]
MKQNNKINKGRRKLLKAATAGLAGILALGTGRVFYLALGNNKQNVAIEEAKKALVSGVECLYADSIKPRGIVLHSGRGSEKDYLTYVVSVEEKNLGKEIDKKIEEYRGDRNPLEDRQKFRFELRKLEEGKESTIGGFPLDARQLASGEEHRAAGNSDPKLSRLRYDRCLHEDNGNLSYGLLETDVLNGHSEEIYAEDRPFKDVFVFKPVGANEKIWVAESETLGFDRASREYYIGTRGAKEALRRKDVVEVSVPMMPSLDSYIDALGKELEKKTTDKYTIRDAKEIVRKSIERAYENSDTRRQLGLPQDYQIIGISGKDVYFTTYLKKPIGRYVIGRAHLPDKKGSNGNGGEK